MTGLLLRLFVKNYTDAENTQVRTDVGKLAGVVGIFCNGLLFFGKLVAGLLSGSVAIVADAVNNLSDASSSVVTLLGFRLAQQPADADHPYGHARYEYLSGLMVAVLILVIGVELVKSSVEKIIHPEAVDFSVLTVVILVGSILVKLWMSFFFGSLGKRIHSLTLEATAVDSRNDVITTAAVLLGCFVGFLFRIKIDGYIGLLVAVFILHSGVNIVKETISPLLGEQADLYSLEGHDIIDELESRALRELNVHLVIHYDPILVNDAEWNEMRQVTQEIIHEIDPAVTMHCFRIVGGKEQKNLVFDLMVPYEAKRPNEELKQEIDRKLRERNIKYGTVIRFDGKE